MCFFLVGCWFLWFPVSSLFTLSYRILASRFQASFHGTIMSKNFSPVPHDINKGRCLTKFLMGTNPEGCSQLNIIQEIKTWTVLGNQSMLHYCQNHSSKPCTMDFSLDRYTFFLLFCCLLRSVKEFPKKKKRSAEVTCHEKSM